MLRLRYLLFAGLIPALVTQPGLTAENWGLCRVPSFEFIAADNLAADETLIEAQSVASEDSITIHLVGDVSIHSEQQNIKADTVLYDRSTNAIQADGNVEFEDPNYRIQSLSVQIDNENERASFAQPSFELPGRHASGQASQLEQFDSDRSQFSDISYTSCDPDNRVWHLEASELNIDRESGRGSAVHTTLYFQEIPFLYLPYFQFPVDDRRMSGILTPRIGHHDNHGNVYELPVYWNMAPNYDMTIRPISYNERGLQLNTENRYLFASGHGQVDLSYLDDDKVDDSRWFQQWRHRSSLAYDIEGDLLLAEVSDGEIFNDFETVAPQYNNTNHLERHLSFTRNGETWYSKLLWQDYETLDETTSTGSRPYNRLPSLLLQATPGPWNENVQTPVLFEWSDFDRDDSVTGSRAHLVSSIKWNASQSWYFFEPELQFAVTDYQLEDNPDDNSISRSLPTLSIDSGLIFERLTGPGGQWLQTLEPRLYFLHTPFEDQDDIPDFDTSLSASTYNNMFKNNRFTGADRIGDANQVTFGLASRLFDNDNGDELLHARIGQIFYFKDRRVSLDGSRDEESKSDVISELDIWPNRNLKIMARLVYDEEEKEMSDRDLSVNYSNQGFAANFGYYFSRDELEQVLASLAYPVNERWSLVAKYHRSLEFEQPVEDLFGIAYETCCWGLKILRARTGDENDDFDETDNSIFFEFTFKGLSQAGQDVDSQLREAVPGYKPAF